MENSRTISFYLFTYDALSKSLIYLYCSSDESRDILKNHGIDISNRKPLFDYISFWKYLNIFIFYKIADFMKIMKVEESKIPIIKNEILKQFINGNTRFTHLYVPVGLKEQIHLVPRAGHCFSELEFLNCKVGGFNENIVLEGLSRISKSIKKLKFYIVDFNDLFKDIKGNEYSGMFKLIEAQRNLNHFNVSLARLKDKLIHNNIEESLIKHADTIQHLQILSNNFGIVTNFLSYLVNLVSLECKDSNNGNWKQLENASLPALKILTTRYIPCKPLASLIENTKGHLTEINIVSYEKDTSNRLIQAIHQNCPKLRYLKLIMDGFDVSELKKLLINCQYLNGLVIGSYCKKFNWDYFFESEILTVLSPPSLYKFKFICNGYKLIELESLKLFFDNWMGRHPMHGDVEKDSDFIEEYKAKGIVKLYNLCYRDVYGDFEWVQKMSEESEFDI